MGWEGVGLCSYLLIGFWYRKDSASAAGLKAFVVNRVGDAGLILGMIFIYHAFGSLDLVDIADNAGALAREGLWEWGPVTIACLLLFVGATGKSAQIPLHVWLPDAMEGPTPVSALIHAATMVTAGVYMVARLGPLYHVSETAMLVVATTGAVTALMAGTIAIVQTDIKRVLAYSTVSQLGFMFLAAGVGAFGVAVFHLYTHAFFKALLFLGSGSVIHAMSGEQDMRKMGGLRTKIPWTFWTFVVGHRSPSPGSRSSPASTARTRSCSGRSGSGHTILFGLALFTALLTAAYMARLLFLTFFGEFRGGHEAEHHLHESPWSMLGPLVLLAAGSIVSGYALWPGPDGHRVRLPEILQPVFRLPEDAAPPRGLAAGGGDARRRRRHPDRLVPLPLHARRCAPRSRRPSRPLLRLFEAKYFFDDVVRRLRPPRVVVGGSDALLWKRVDAGVIDGAVNGAGTITAAIAETLRPVQTGFVRHYALLVLAGAVAIVSYLLWS